jgi:hypothetical protein
MQKRGAVMDVRLPALISLAALLTGCNTPAGTSPFTSAVPTGDDRYPGMSILPVGDVKLAQLYLAHRNPANPTQPYITTICTDDFAQTKALADIAEKYNNTQGISLQDDSAVYTTSLNASVTGIPIKIVTIGGLVEPTATTTIKYSGVQVYSIDELDAQNVLNNLGSNCKSLLRKEINAGSQVFVLAGAVKASSISVEVKKNNEGNATASVKVGNLSPGFAVGGKSDSDVTLTGSNLYFKAVPPSVGK